MESRTKTLFAAIDSGDVQSVAHLIRYIDINKANKNGTTPLARAIYAQNVENLLHSREMGIPVPESQLDAARAANDEIVHTLLQAGAKHKYEDYDGLYLLERAASANNSIALRALLMAGYNPEDPQDKKILNRALLKTVSIFYINNENIHMLLAAGADINAWEKKSEDNTENTVLCHAAALGRVEVVDAILKAGAGVNVRNGIGETALMQAVRGATFSDNRDFIKIVSILKRAGANIYAKNSNNQTAYKLARQSGHTCAYLLGLLSSKFKPGLYQLHHEPEGNAKHQPAANKIQGTPH